MHTAYLGHILVTLNLRSTPAQQQWNDRVCQDHHRNWWGRNGTKTCSCKHHGSWKASLVSNQPCEHFPILWSCYIEPILSQRIEQGFYSMVKLTTHLEYSKEHGTWSENVLHFLFHGSPERQHHWMGEHHHYHNLCHVPLTAYLIISF